MAQAVTAFPGPERRHSTIVAVSQSAKTGYIANSFDEFVTFTDLLLTQPGLLLGMGLAAREHALSTSWEPIFEGMYKAYERCFYADSVRHEILDVTNI